MGFAADGCPAHPAPPLPCLVGAAQCLRRGQGPRRVQPRIASWSGKMHTHVRTPGLTHLCMHPGLLTLAVKAAL